MYMHIWTDDFRRAYFVNLGPGSWGVLIRVGDEKEGREVGFKEAFSVGEDPK